MKRFLVGFLVVLAVLVFPACTSTGGKLFTSAVNSSTIVGAGLGSVVPGVGTATGAGIGFVIGYFDWQGDCGKDKDAKQFFSDGKTWGCW